MKSPAGRTRQIAELAAELATAERRAWEALAHYRFRDFGHWSALWVHLNRIGRFRRTNPFRDLVLAARAHQPLVQHPKPAPLLGEREAA